jgi:HipA-like protein
MSSLNVFYEDILVGQLSQSEDLTYSFVYSQEWLTHENKFPLSLAMPLPDLIKQKVPMNF